MGGVGRNPTEITRAFHCLHLFYQMKNIGENPIRGVWFYAPEDKLVESSAFQAGEAGSSPAGCTIWLASRVHKELTEWKDIHLDGFSNLLFIYLA